MKHFDGYKHLIVMLFDVLKHFDSLRELEICMKAEAHIQRSQEFFAHYAKYLTDSFPSKSYKGNTHEPKDWKKFLYMMDSTTISLFDNILKGVRQEKRKHENTYGDEISCGIEDIDIAQFQRLTKEGVCYVTKMKRNLKFKVFESVTYM